MWSFPIPPQWTCATYTGGKLKLDTVDKLEAACKAGRVAALDGLERARLSSIELEHLDDRVLDALAAPPFLPHLVALAEQRIWIIFTRSLLAG